jgi:hypothetical protein
MAAANPTSLERRLLDWADRPATARFYRDGQLLQIEAALRDPRRTTQLSIGAWMLGTWYLGSGQARVLRSDLAGWDDVRIGAALQRTGLLLRAQRAVRRTRHGDVPDLPVLQGANCIAVGLALDDPGGAPLFEIFRGLPDGGFADGDAWPLFVRELLELRAGRRPTVTPRLDLYGEILTGWLDDPALLARRLARLLDRHLERTRGSPGSPADFEEPGVLMFPVSVLAVRSVRTAFGLPMPKVEHPLMFTNLLNSAPRGPWPPDPMVTRLERELRRA